MNILLISVSSDFHGIVTIPFTMEKVLETEEGMQKIRKNKVRESQTKYGKPKEYRKSEEIQKAKRL